MVLNGADENRELSDTHCLLQICFYSFKNNSEHMFFLMAGKSFYCHIERHHIIKIVSIYSHLGLLIPEKLT
jgi:hypothetical protein